MAIKVRMFDKKFLRKLNKELGYKASESKDEVIRVARENAPVDTGKLKKSIEGASDAEGLVVGSNVKYASFVEFKTFFLTKGFRDSLAQIKSIYKRKIT